MLPDFVGVVGIDAMTGLFPLPRVVHRRSGFLQIGIFSVLFK
jgi:hypothetical protein